MNAVEASQYSDILQSAEYPSQFLKKMEDGNWYFFDFFDLRKFHCNLKDSKNNYIPLVPKRLYLEGQKVTILEAITSGQIFRWGDDYYRFDNNSILEVCHHGKWKICDTLNVRTDKEVYIQKSLPEVWVDCTFDEAVQYLKGNPDNRIAKVEINEFDDIDRCFIIMHNNELKVKNKGGDLLSNCYRFLDYYDGKWQIKK